MCDERVDHNATMWRISRRSICTCVTLRQLVPAPAVPLVANAAALAGAKARKQAKVVVAAQEAQLDSSLAADVETLVNQAVKPKRGRPKTKSAASLDGSGEASALDAGSSDLSSASSGSDSDQAAPGAAASRKRSKTPRGGKMAVADASAAAQASAVDVTAAWSKRANVAVAPPAVAPAGEAAVSSSATGAAAGVAAVASHVAGAASAFEASLLSATSAGAATAAASPAGVAAVATPPLSPTVLSATAAADSFSSTTTSSTGVADPGVDYAEQLRLYARQYDSEMRALDNHVASYKAIVSDLVTMGRGSTLPVAQRMAVSWFVPLAEGIDRQQAAAMEGRFSSPEAQQVAHLLMLLPPDKLAVMTIHEVLSGTLANAGAVAYGYLARRVGEAVQTEVNLTKLRYKNRRAWSTLAKEHKTEGGGNLHALRRKARTALEEEEDWEPRTTLKLGAYLVSLMIDTCRVEVGENGRLTAPRAGGSGGGEAGGSGTSADGGLDQAAAAEAFAAALASTASGSAGVASSARSAAGGAGGVGATAVSQAALSAAAAKQAALAGSSAGSPSATTTGATTTGPGKELKPGVVFRGNSVGIASLYHSTLKVMRVPAAAAAAGGGSSGGAAGAAPTSAAAAAHATAARASAGAIALEEHEDMSLAAAEDLAAAAAVEEDAAIAAAAAASGQPTDALASADAADASSGANSGGTGLPAFKHVYAYANQLTLTTGPHASTTDRPSNVRYSHAKAVGVIAMHPELLKMMMDAVASFQHAALYPMVVKPRDWTGPTSGGFLKHQAPVLRLQGGVKQQADMLRSANCPKVYEALSIMGRTPWRMNQPVLDVVNAVWESGG